MSSSFFDSSALAKRYLTETGSPRVAALADPAAGNTVIVAEITRVEVAAALASRQRAGAITLAERDGLVTLLLRHFDTEYRLIAIDPAITSRAVTLRDTRQNNHPTRNVLRVACCVNQRYATRNTQYATERTG